MEVAHSVAATAGETEASALPSCAIDRMAYTYFGVVKMVFIYPEISAYAGVG